MMRTRAFVIILFVMFIAICASIANADDFDWPRWRGPNGDGISMETDWNPEALAGGPKILWNVDVGIGYSNVAIKDNRLYTMGNRTVFCFNAETGKEIWQYSFERFCMGYSTPTIDDKYIYILNTEGILVCLKAKNGKLRWKKDLVEEYKTEKIPYGYAGSPVIVDDLIVLNVNSAGIAVDKKTGDLIWASNIHTNKKNSYGYHATPVLYDYEGNRCTLLFSGIGLSLVGVKTGKQLWFYEWGRTNTANCADPIVIEDKVFLSAGYLVDKGALLEITGSVPSVIWENENMGSEFSASVYVDGYLYQLRSIDVNTGDVMWEKEMKMASLMAADDKLIILEEDGTLHIAEATPSSYQEISSGDVLGGELKVRTFYTPPVLYKGKIYCRNMNGDLICIDVSK
jgi:outer membrane protein assembly factor BamB